MKTLWKAAFKQLWSIFWIQILNLLFPDLFPTRFALSGRAKKEYSLLCGCVFLCLEWVFCFCACEIMCTWPLLDWYIHVLDNNLIWLIWNSHVNFLCLTRLANDDEHDASVWEWNRKAEGWVCVCLEGGESEGGGM